MLTTPGTDQKCNITGALCCDYLGPIEPSQILDLQRLHHFHAKQLYCTKNLYKIPVTKVQSNLKPHTKHEC